MLQKCFCLVLGLLCLSARADDVKPVAPLAADASMDTLLDALDQRGKTLDAFTAKLSDTTGDPALGNERTRTGQIFFQRRGDGSDRIHVVFDAMISGRISQPQKIEYLLEGSWLFDRNYTQKIEVKRQVLKPGQKVNLLKLGEGPFPLPIGQDKADVKKMFDAKIVPLAKDDPQGTIHLQLTPKPGTEFEKKFSVIDAWVDRQLRMPTVIETVDASGNEQHRTKLDNLQLNPANLADAAFTLPPIDNTWNQRTEAYER